MANNNQEDNTIYQVVVNHDKQYYGSRMFIKVHKPMKILTFTLFIRPMTFIQIQ